MDLSLRGSQISLATRFKPNTPNVNYPVLHQRPGSANVHRLSRASPFLRRPMSADSKLLKSLNSCVRFSESVLKDTKFSKNKRFPSCSSSSSSDILKLLLDEPIKRTWFRKNSDDISESDCSLGQKICNIAGQQLLDSEGRSEENSIAEDIESCSGEVGDSQSLPIIKIQKIEVNEKNSHPEQSKDSMLNNNNSLNGSTKRKQVVPGDFWHESKADLPGRVSFSKNDIIEVDLSDCENEMQSSHNNFGITNKKSVHFRENVETSVYTDETSKCSTDRCTYGESSFTAPSEMDCPECQKPENSCYCTYTCNPSQFDCNPSQECGSNTISLPHNPTHHPSIAEDDTTSSYIQHYKAQIEDQEQKFQLELKLLDNNSQPQSQPSESFTNYITNVLELHTTSSINDFEYENKSIPLPQDRPSLSVSSSFDIEQQNDLSQNRNLNQLNFSKEANKKFILNGNRLEMNNAHESSSSADTTRKTDSIINNYLRVAQEKQAIKGTKKQNNSASSKSDLHQRSTISRRSKSASAGDISRSSSSSTSAGGGVKPRMKKTGTYSCLRQDTNLDEFHIEKVDSWMSLHDDNIVSRDRRSPEIEAFNPPSSSSQLREYDLSTDPSNDSSNEGSTYDEIVSVIKEIEEDKRREEACDTKSDISFKLQTLLSADTPDSALNAEKKDSSTQKFKDIYNYLDNVENSCDRALLETRRSLPESSRSEIEFAIEPDIAENVPKIPDLLMLPNHQLARRIVALSLRANELSNAIQLSKEHVKQIRSERQKSVRQEKQNANNRLKEQKKQFEGMVARHQGFIEQLLKDKGLLCEKVAALTRRLESQNQAWEHKLQTEVTRVKEATLAGEKIRRERWVRENTKKIKELTIKGLEMEINKMSMNHQKEVTELKRQHQQVLLDSGEDARLKHEQLEKSIRESCAEDREETIAKERNAIRERYEKQLQDEQKSFDEQRNKLLEDFASERERLQTDLRQKDIDFESKRQDLLKEKEKSVEQVYAEYKEKFQQQDQKYQTRINSIQKQFESDFLIWKREFENTCKLREVEAENAIRQHYRAERDRQIDSIVGRMDSESQKSQEDFENKFSRLKEKYEHDLKEAEISERILKEKFNDTRNKLAESDAHGHNLHAEIKQMQIELEHSKKMCEDFLAEKEHLKENARKEIQMEITSLQTDRENEIQKIYKRVQQAIEKKDASMDILQKENVVLRERSIKLEAIIRQQRKDYCIK